MPNPSPRMQFKTASTIASVMDFSSHYLPARIFRRVEQPHDAVHAHSRTIRVMCRQVSRVSISAAATKASRVTARPARPDHAGNA